MLVVRKAALSLYLAERAGSLTGGLAEAMTIKGPLCARKMLPIRALMEFLNLDRHVQPPGIMLAEEIL